MLNVTATQRLDAKDARATAAAGPRPAVVLFLMIAVWVLNYADRNLINALGQPIKDDLQLSDGMLGLLTGFAFIALYSVVTIPLARLADRTNRARVIGFGVIAWSGFTIATGLVTSASQMIAARIAVGIGEASSGGPTQALLSDYYPPEKRGRVMALLSMATFIGILCAFVLGSAIGAQWGWRAAFLVFGPIGIIVGALTLFLVKDLPRGASEPVAYGLRDDRDARSTWSTLRFLFSQRSFTVLSLTFCFGQMTNAGLLAWMTPFLQRTHHLENAQAGAIGGPIMGFAGIAGALLAVAFMTRLCRRDMAWTIWAPAISMLVAAPALAWFLYAPTLPAALIGCAISAVCAGFQPGPLIAAVQSVAKPQMRALAGGVTILLLNLVGWGVAPITIGIASDVLTPLYGESALRYAMGFIVLTSLLGGLSLPLAARTFAADIERARTPAPHRAASSA